MKSQALQRLWRKLSARLTIRTDISKAIIASFADLKDGRDYENLYRSALCRAKADWIVGINATRLFSKLYNKKLNVGRVQTPTLAILFDREKSIADFKKEKYYTVRLKADGLDAVSEKISRSGKYGLVRSPRSETRSRHEKT